MRKFETLTSKIAPLLEADIDTDAILPARFLLLLEKHGLGEYAFRDRRRAGMEPPFILDDPELRSAEILLTGPRFGIGSSREHAVWALADHGIRVIIAPSFGEIFHANCFNNGILAITLEDDALSTLKDLASRGEPVTVDLQAQHIRAPGRSIARFEIAEHHKRALLLGQDQIDAILAEDEAAISAFEQKQARAAPWLYLNASRRDYLDTFIPARTASKT